MTLEGWRGWTQYYGGVPEHLTTPAAHRQALELASELWWASAVVGVPVKPFFAMLGLAFAVCKAHAEGRTIRSLAFVGQGLMRRCDDGDDAWAYDLPCRIEQTAFETASGFASQGVTALEGWKIAIDRRELLSTFRVEELAGMIRDHSWNGVTEGINHAIEQLKATGNLEPDLSANKRIYGWGWFDGHIGAAKKEKAPPAPVGRPIRHAKRKAAA